MVKRALAAALIFGAASAPAFAKSGPVQYSFATADGGDYCDGLLLTQEGKLFTGIHNALGGCTEGDAAGGFYADGFGPNAMGAYDTVTPKTYLATITTEDQPNGGTNFLLVYNLDIKGRRWAVYLVKYGAAPISGGMLFIGTDKLSHSVINRPSWRP